METLKTCPACKDVTIEEVEHSEADEVREYCRECLLDTLWKQLPAEIETLIHSYEDKIKKTLDIARVTSDLHMAMAEMILQAHWSKLGMGNTYEQEKNRVKELKNTLLSLGADYIPSPLELDPSPDNLNAFVQEANYRDKNIQAMDALDYRHAHTKKSDKK
jgi:hypothetical protein